jgi:hypothetical protein
VGSCYDNLYYFVILGVGRLINYYFIGNEKTEDGIINMVFGLGKYIVDGNIGFCFFLFYTFNIL